MGTKRRRAVAPKMMAAADEEDGDESDASRESSGDGGLLDSFASRLEEEGGATRLQLESEAGRAGKTLQDGVENAKQSVTKTLDLDGRRAQPSFPGGEGLLDTGSWRLTVAFFVLTIGLSLYGAATTDFTPKTDF